MVVVGGSSEAGGGEEASDELMLLHCSSSVHTRRPALLKPFAPPPRTCTEARVLRSPH